MSRFGLWVERLSRITWISLSRLAAVTSFMKARNSSRRRRLEWRPMILPVATWRAANSVRAVSLVVVRLAGERAAVRQLEIALGALQGLDRRLLVDGEHDRILGRRHVEANDLGRFGHKVGVIALAPGLATRKVDLLSAEKAPDILLMHVAKRARDQHGGPIGAACGRLLI